MIRKAPVSAPPSEAPWDAVAVGALIHDLESLRRELVALEGRMHGRLGNVHPDHSDGAVNLVHYLGMRHHDMRGLQERLAWLGVSSLGRSESHVLANLDKALGVLHRLVGRTWTSRAAEEPAGFVTARRLLATHTESLLGPCPSNRPVRIMVTMPAEAAHDAALVRAMLSAGMDCARINCAHDDQATWDAIVKRVRRAARDLGRPCRILMDLGGPKLRTGDVAPGPAVLKWRPARDAFGHVTSPACVHLRPEGDSTYAPTANACVDVDPEWIAGLEAGEVVEFVDARGSSRTLTVLDPLGRGWWTESRQTSYLVPDTVLYVVRGKTHRRKVKTRVSGIAPVPQELRLARGDTLVLTRDPRPGVPARRSEDGRLLQPASISCSMPEVFADVQPGERIWLDDGRIGGVIRRVKRSEMHVEITVAREEGERLGPDKGINLPDSELHLPALTEKDLADLAFVASRADLVGLSFVQRPADVKRLQERLAELGGERLGIILKIETRRAFEALPELLLQAMASPAVGVMIARGDLAVECGYERLAEVQEEILWLAEAAHLPVIWATQVLETLAKTGLPSRAEITDAAMGERAECVMLNKGPHIIDAIQVLDDILSRMQSHQEKKRAMLRKLHWWNEGAIATE